MTYTILARCEQTWRLGIGIATYSLGVGGYCPFFLRGVAALSTQAFANPALGLLALKSLDASRSLAQVMGDLAAADIGFDYRQVAILGIDGSVAMHTGRNCRTWAGHETGNDFVAFGNVLAGQPTVTAIAHAFQHSAGADLAERLLGALEAGRDAGGQAGVGGTHLPERSAALMIKGDDINRDIDLRVDMHDDAVTELRRVYTGYALYIDYYALRARDPGNTPTQDVWTRKNLIQV